MPAGRIRKTRNRLQRPGRKKISTTVAAHTADFFDQLIASGQAATLAEAIDHTVDMIREEEFRRTLDHEATAYYDSLSDAEVAEQQAWGEFAGRALFVESEE